MNFVKASGANLVAGTTYYVTTNSGGELDRNNNLRPGKEGHLSQMKFVRRRDLAAEIRAKGGEPMSEYGPSVIFSFEDRYGENQREFPANQLYVGPAVNFGSQSSSSYSQGQWGQGKKKRRTTNSSRVRRRSKTRKHRRATGGGR